MMTTRARFHRPLPEVVRAWAMSLDDGVYGERRRGLIARETDSRASGTDGSVRAHLLLLEYVLWSDCGKHLGAKYGRY